MNSKDIKHLVIAFALYFNVGMINSITFSLLGQELEKHGAIQIEPLQYVYATLALRPIQALILDTYYITSLGKRRTQIWFGLVMMIAVLIFIIYKYDQSFLGKQIGDITVQSIILILSSNYVEIGLDSWTSNNLGEEMKSYMGSTRYLAIFFGFTMATKSTGTFNTSLQTLYTYLLIANIILIPVTKFLDETSSACDFGCKILLRNCRKLLKLTYQSRYVMLNIFFLTFQLGNAVVETGIYEKQVAIQEALQNDFQISTVYFVTLGVGLLASIIINKISPFNTFQLSYIFRAVNNFALYGITAYYTDYRTYFYWYELIYHSLNALIYVSLFCIRLRIDRIIHFIFYSHYHFGIITKQNIFRIFDKIIWITQRNWCIHNVVVTYDFI
ncbi:hypothetical protein pb186bvf_011301 [Paramecium bursaria]